MSRAINPLRQKYLDHIVKQKSSGMSIKKYCLEHSLVPHKFGYYRTYKVKSKIASGQSALFSSIKLKSVSDSQTAKIEFRKPRVDPVWLAGSICK